MRIKILYINTPNQDYLPDSILLGLKSLVDLFDVDEYPVKHILYKEDKSDNNNIRGFGFTLYNLLSNSLKKEFKHDFGKKNISQYDYVIFSSIHRQYGIYYQLYPYLEKNKTLIFDGEDIPNIFPFSGYFFKKPYYWFIPRPHRYFKYYKREITEKTLYYLHYLLVPQFIGKHLKLPKNILPTSFSIPSEKVIKSIPVKTKLFPRHIVDEEVCNNVPDSVSKYAFTNELEYYNDLQTSKYGITTKRAGWDCLRHYEIAANGAVICFKNLQLKPTYCAPHGLIPDFNCISYTDYNDLMSQINKLSDADYDNLQERSLSWVNENSCEQRVQKIFNLL